MLNRLLWFWKRLRVMPAAELPYRLRETLLHQLFRSRLAVRAISTVPRELEIELLPSFPLNLERLRKEWSSDSLTSLQEEVQALKAGRIRLLNQDWPLHTRTDWALDPRSGNSWDWQRYTFSIPRRRGQGPGDAKLVWELSRLLHLQVLALGSLILADEEAREIVISDLQSWIDENPPFRGLGYASGIEVAHRVISILVIIGLLGRETIPRSLSRSLWRTLAVHGAWLALFPSRYSSANNHALAEAAALYILGTLAPELPRATSWRRSGELLLPRLAKSLILEDGVGSEQSISYLAYTVEWFLAARRVASSSDLAWHSVIDERLAAACRFLSSTCDDSGGHPNIGDEDGAMIITHSLARDRYVLSVIGTAANTLRVPGITPRCYSLDGRALLYDASDNSSRRDARRESCSLSIGGYSIFRWASDGSDRLLVFDHGPLGYGQTAGHGHADALSLWLHVDGIPVLVDSGTYRYDCDSGWRDYLRGTLAHNTLCLERENQSSITGAFLWRERAQSILESYESDGSRNYAAASHDGYVKTFGVIHRRILEQSGDQIIVLDELQGEGIFDVTISFHFAPNLSLETGDDDSWQVRHGDRVLASLKSGEKSLRLRRVRQHESPGPGATSSKYNSLVDSEALLLEGRVEIPIRIRTEICCHSVA